MNRVPSAQPEKRTENTRKTHGVFLDLIDRQAAINAIYEAFFYLVVFLKHRTIIL